MDAVLKFLTDNSTLVLVGIVTGLLIRYVPVVGKIPNWVTPWLNGLLIFFGAWTVPPAQAGILGSIGGEIGGLAKLFVSAGLSAMTSAIYEAFLHHPLKVLEAKGMLRKQP